ncbi:conserved unknown protein [Ectocarpus siliculosus]|uniref:Uncharacterized protein n=1 Tax=Ectocarpus siliculosus TaxID=2880 RepID=D8LQ95_ECTSI|nr:conserved unknown protein [Ectocarpus siliculosus]|eukprot:CBN77475.1 conserved unknown protein [Ectocarpus siliculosus]
MVLGGRLSVATLLLSLPATASGFLIPSFCRGCTARAWCSAAAADRPPSADAARRRSRLPLKKEDLPDETLRQMADAGRALKELEEEYWKSLDPDEIAIEKKCAAGLACLKAGMLEKGCEYYTSAADLSPPSARTWPLGVILYYLGRYEEAAVRLDTDIRSFEKQFEECATDERIWQAAAWIRGAREAGADVEQVAAALPPLPISEPNALRRTVYNMFRGGPTPEDVQQVAKVGAGGIDYFGVDFFSEVFLGLYHDAHGNELEAETYILAACGNTYPNPDDLWYHTPRIHAKARNWTIPG